MAVTTTVYAVRSEMNSNLTAKKRGLDHAIWADAQKKKVGRIVGNDVVDADNTSGRCNKSFTAPSVSGASLAGTFLDGLALQATFAQYRFVVCGHSTAQLGGVSKMPHKNSNVFFYLHGLAL